MIVEMGDIAILVSWYAVKGAWSMERLAESSIQVWADEDKDVSDGRDAVELFFMDNVWSDFDLAPILMTQMEIIVAHYMVVSYYHG